jgi:hypothetical protein
MTFTSSQFASLACLLCNYEPTWGTAWPTNDLQIQYTLSRAHNLAHGAKVETAGTRPHISRVISRSGASVPSNLADSSCGDTATINEEPRIPTDKDFRLLFLNADKHWGTQSQVVTWAKEHGYPVVAVQEPNPRRNLKGKHISGFDWHGDADIKYQKLATCFYIDTDKIKSGLWLRSIALALERLGGSTRHISSPLPYM